VRQKGRSEILPPGAGKSFKKEHLLGRQRASSSSDPERGLFDRRKRGSLASKSAAFLGPSQTFDGRRRVREERARWKRRRSVKGFTRKGGGVAPPILKEGGKGVTKIQPTAGEVQGNDSPRPAEGASRHTKLLACTRRMRKESLLILARE